MSDQPSPVRASAQALQEIAERLDDKLEQQIGPSCQYTPGARMLRVEAILAALSAAEARGRQQAEQDQIDVEAFRANLHMTYNGGWHGNEDGMKAFHHGMDTVCNALKGGEAPRLVERVQQAEQARDALASWKMLAGDEPGVWPCGCRSRIVDSFGKREIFESCGEHEEQAERVAALTQALKDIRADPFIPTKELFAKIDAALTGAQAKV